MSEELSISQALDVYMEKASMCALELADRAEKPYVTHVTNQFVHPLTNQLRTSCVFVYAGPKSAQVERVIAKAAKDFLTNHKEKKGKINGSNIT